MTELLHTLARLSGLRDRSPLLQAVAGLAIEHAPALVLARPWVRLVDAGQVRWQPLTPTRTATAAHLAADDADEPDVPSVAAVSLAASAGQGLMAAGPGRWWLLLPCLGEVNALLELRGASVLADGEQDVLDSLATLYGNLRGLVEDNESDSLTGLLNRKSFDEAFARLALEQGDPVSEETARHPLRTDREAWLGVVDIDHFKRINDVHGHLIGDEVLLMVAQLMRQTVRQGDLVYRFGGEEFVLLLRADGTARAQAAFERLRAQVMAHDFPRVHCLTVSVGFTPVRAQDTPSDAFGRADAALYWAKQNGRNRVAAWEELRSQGLLGDEASAGQVEYF